jgi:hypothetical protein
MTEWEPSVRERLMAAAAGLDWSRAMLWRSRDHLERVPRERIRPLAEDLGAVYERLAGLQRLVETMYAVEPGRG